MTIVAYQFQADVYCPACAIAVFAERNKLPAPVSGKPEAYFDEQAKARGIDRMSEVTFDSDDFPKVVFSPQVEGWLDDEGVLQPEVCEGCGDAL